MNNRENKEAIDFINQNDAEHMMDMSNEPSITKQINLPKEPTPKKIIPEKVTQRPEESIRVPKVVLSPAQLKKKKKNEPDIDEELLHKPYGEEPLPSEVTPLRPEWRAYPELETLYEYVPEVVEEVLIRPDFTDSQKSHVDLSINSFTYLKSLGYKEAIWELGQEFDYDDCNGSCSANAGSFFSIDDIITTSDVHSSQHSYFPDKPFVALAHPNCYSSDTKVLTDKGLKYFKDVTEKDLICSLNPKTEEIEYVKWINKVEYFYIGKMINFKGRGFNALVTPNHNMAYSTAWSKDIKITEAQELINHKNLKQFFIPKTGKWIGKKTNENDILLAKFFGWYISEGSITKRKDSFDSYQISIAQIKKENRIEIETLLKKMNLKFGIGSCSYTIQGDFARWIATFNLGKSFEKRIPSFIKDMDIEGISAFMDTYCKGDGSKRIKDCFGYMATSITYHTSSIQLVSDVIELILKMGKSIEHITIIPKGTISKFKNGIYASNYNVYNIPQSKEKRTRFTLTNSKLNKSKITEVDYNDFVYCLELEKNHILCFEREGNIGWSGNCHCSMKCYSPTSIDQIPDSAPYLPMHADKKLLKICKEKLLSLLQDIDIDRWTSLYNIDQQMNLDQMEDFYDNMKNASSDERIKTAEWIERVVPIKLKRSFMLYFPMGILRPVPANYIGFQLSRSENISKVYLAQLGYVIEMPSDLIEELTLEPSDDLDIEKNPFVNIDGELGIIIFHHDYERTICYLPEFNEKMEVDSFQVMKII